MLLIWKGDRYGSLSLAYFSGYPNCLTYIEYKIEAQNKSTMNILKQVGQRMFSGKHSGMHFMCNVYTYLIYRVNPLQMLSFYSMHLGLIWHVDL